MKELKKMICSDAQRIADVGECIDRRLFDVVRKAQMAGVDLIYTRRESGVCILDPDGEYIGGIVSAKSPTDFATLALCTIECIEKALGGTLETEMERIKCERDEALTALDRAEDVIAEQKKVIAILENHPLERVS